MIFLSAIMDKTDCKTSMTFYIVFTMNRPKHISEHHVLFLTTLLYSPLRTRDLSPSDLLNTFHFEHHVFS